MDHGFIDKKMTQERIFRRRFKIKTKLKAIRSWRANVKNLRKTAKRLGLYRSTLRNWIKQEEELKRSNHPEMRTNVQQK